MARRRRRLLDPKLDVVFKLLFAHPRNKRSLIALLTAVLRPPHPIGEVEVLNPEVRKEDIKDKGMVLDLRIRLADGTVVDVEMQSEQRVGSRKRMSEEERRAEAPLVRWARFLAARTDEELAAAAQEDEMISEAKETLEQLSQDPKARELASWREMQHALYRMELGMAQEQAEAKGLRKGIREGKREGEAKGKREVLLMLLGQAGVTPSEEQRQQIETCKDPTLLDEWIRRAFAGASVDDIIH